MFQSLTSRREDRMMLLAGYIMLAAVAAIGLVNMSQQGGRWEIAAVLLVAFGVLLARIPEPGASPRKIHLYLAVQSGLVVALFMLAPLDTGFALLYMILSAQVMLLLPKRQGVLWITVFILVTAIAMLGYYGWPGGLVLVLLYAGGYFFFSILANALVRADEERRESERLLNELQEAHRQLQSYAERVEELAVVEERNRLAREMHDTLGHRLTVAAVQLEGAQRLCPRDPDQAARMVGTVREQVREALSELRSTVARLRAPLEADLQLCRALERLAGHFEGATGLTVHLMLPAEMQDLPDAHRLALYRAAQEALTNVHRHAQAQDVWLQLTRQDGIIALLVSDNGTGFHRESARDGGYGLSGLRERAAQLGGELYLEPRSGGGTQLSFRLPLPAGEGDA
jgi:signal transduction histidine kinase